MQPIKISLLGDYFDCQIYRGRLYLWTFDGELKVYNWRTIVESLIDDAYDELAMEFSFLDSSYLYTSSIAKLINDEEFSSLLINKFNRLASKEYIIEQSKLGNYLYGEQDVPGKNLSTDTEIYGNVLYFINESGLFKANAHRYNIKYPVGTKPTKLWDCNLMSIKANRYPQLVLSGGDEGLFELNMSKTVKTSKLRAVEDKSKVSRVSDSHSSFANYSYLSIYNSSVVSSSFMALFKWQKNQSEDYLFNSREFIREYDSIVDDNSIFDDAKNTIQHLSWGLDDKIYNASANKFEIVKFNNYAKLDEGEKYFNSIRKMPIHPWQGRVISGGVAVFGVIVECERSISVMLSNNEVLEIEGPITRWRVYPRSMNYTNQLHVVLEDRIDIYSFNQDFFMSQPGKYMGAEFRDYSSRSYKSSGSYTATSKPFSAPSDDIKNGRIDPLKNINKGHEIPDEDLPF